jgi:hypothetical protein
MQRDNLEIVILPKYNTVHITYRDESGNQGIQFKYESLELRENFTEESSGVIEVNIDPEVDWSYVKIQQAYGSVYPDFEVSELEEYLPIDNRHYWFSHDGYIVHHADCYNLKDAIRKVNYGSQELYECINKRLIPGVYPIKPPHIPVYELSDYQLHYFTELFNGYCKVLIDGDINSEDIQECCLRTLALYWLIRQMWPSFGHHYYFINNELPRILSMTGFEARWYLGGTLKEADEVLLPYIEEYLSM